MCVYACLNSLYDQGLVLKDEGFVQHCGDGMVFGPGLEHQALVSRNLVFLQLLHGPLPYSRGGEGKSLHNMGFIFMGIATMTMAYDNTLLLTLLLLLLGMYVCRHTAQNGFSGVITNTFSNSRLR